MSHAQQLLRDIPSQPHCGCLPPACTEPAKLFNVAQPVLAADAPDESSRRLVRHLEPQAILAFARQLAIVNLTVSRSFPDRLKDALILRPVLQQTPQAIHRPSSP